MIHSIEEVLADETYHGQEVTARCTVNGEPRSGREGGEKTLCPVRTTSGGNDFLSIWHESPRWTDAFGATNSAVQSVIEEVPLQRGEVVLARGIPNRHGDKRYLNVTELIIRDPDTAIGKSEMRSASECPRIYNLRFEKNIYSPGRYDLSPGSVKGRIVHTLVERAVEEGFQERFEAGWSETEVDRFLEELIDQQYSVEMALCRLAWISPNRIKEHALEAASRLLTDTEFTHRVANASSVETEIGLSSAVGFNGRVDLVLDGVPYDLKTNFRVSNRQREHHRFQLRIYLLAFVLESLDSGEHLRERIENGISGHLVYPNIEGQAGTELDEVRLREEDVEDILELRNEAAILRDGFGVPSTYHRDCHGCSFKTATTSADDEEILPPPCQFYCQSERRWQCFETDDDGEVITQCPLFDECDQRLEFRDPAVTDHYTQLRQALNAERKHRRELGYELDRMAPETLTQAGLRIPHLQLESLEGQRRIIFTSEVDIVPSFTPGARVRLSQTGSEYHQEATYYGQLGDRVIFQLETTPNSAFLDPTATYEALRTVAVDTLPRDLLNQLDYAQRGKVSPLTKTGGEAQEVVEMIDSDSIQELADYTDNKELYVDVPVRSDRNEVVLEVVKTLATQQFPTPADDGEIPTEEQRVLVLSVRPAMTDLLEEGFSSIADVVRMDGFAGGAAESVSAMTKGHQIYESLRDASVVISSAKYALSENVFHAMRDGDESVRQHTDRFFDSVMLVGAERLVEPQFHFLGVLGDRIVAIGDTQRTGPEMVSGEAQEARLSEPYFNRLYRRFANIESGDSRSMQISGELTGTMATGFSELDLHHVAIDGEFDFVNTQGSVASAIGETTLEFHIPPASEGNDVRFVRLAPVDRVDALQITRAFQGLRNIDASSLTIQKTYTIQDIRFEVKTSNPIDNDDHHLKINVPVHANPYLHRRLTQNEDEAETVANVCSDREPDLVVTPFAAHASAIRTKLNQKDFNIPVRLPAQLSGNHADSAVVSLAVTGEERIVAPPVSDIETLYTVFNCAQEITLVGDRNTLERNSLIARLFESL